MGLCGGDVQGDREVTTAWMKLACIRGNLLNVSECDTTMPETTANSHSFRQPVLGMSTIIQVLR